MTNLKRVFSMVLALVMLVGMMVMPTAAADFADADEIVNKEAVSITAGMGLFAGADGKFMPKGTVTRAQMATIIVKMMYGSDFNANSFKGAANPFTDTAAFEGGWAEGYINACFQLGVVKGYGDGTFKPGKSVTTAEAVTMIINALKVDAGQGEWPLTVMAKAAEMQLFGDLNPAPATNDALIRDQLAVITLEGLQYSKNGNSGYKVNGLPGTFETYADALQAVMLSNGTLQVGDITEAVGEDTLAGQVYELKIARGFVTSNQAAGAEATVLTLANGDQEDFNIETGVDMLGHYVSVYYREAYKNDAEPGKVYAIVDESQVITVTEEITSAKEYKAVFAKNYDVAQNGILFDETYEPTTKLENNMAAAIAGYTKGSAAAEGTYIIADGQIVAYIAPVAVTASRVTIVNKVMDNEYIMLSGVQARLNNTEGDDVVVEYSDIAVDDYVTFVNVQGQYVLTKAESVTGVISKSSTTTDGVLTITVDGKEYVDFGTENNNFVDDSSVSTLAADIANVNYGQRYTIYLAPDNSVICYKEEEGVAFSLDNTVYLLGSISTVAKDTYGTYNKNHYGRGIDMNGDEVMVLLGVTVDTDKSGNGGTETVGRTAAVSEGFYTVKNSTMKEERNYNIRTITAFNTNTRNDKPYAISYTSGIDWNFTGKLTTGGATYGKNNDTRFLVLDEAAADNGEELSATVTTGSCSVWLAQGQKLHSIVTDQTNGTHTMQVCVIHTQSQVAASEMIYVSAYKNATTGRISEGYVYEVYNAKNGDEREIMLATGGDLEPGFYAVSTDTDGLNTLRAIPDYTVDTNPGKLDNTDGFYYYNFTYESVMTAYDGATIWTDGVVNNNACASNVPVIDARNQEQIAQDGVPKVTGLNDIIALWSSQPNVTVTLDICYYSGGNRVSAIFVRGVGESVVNPADVGTILFTTGDPRDSALTAVVVATSGDSKAAYAVGDQVQLDPAKVVLLDCSGACWDDASWTGCEGFFSIQSATQDAVKLKHLRAIASNGTMGEHNVITAWSENDQVATYDAHTKYDCGYYCFSTVLTQTEASYYLDLAGATDESAAVIDMAGSGIDSLSELKAAAQASAADPGNNGIVVSYYIPDGGKTPEVFLVCATDEPLVHGSTGLPLWMAAPGETVYLPKGRSNNTGVADDAQELNGAFSRWGSTAFSLAGDKAFLYTTAAYMPSFGLAGFYTVNQEPDTSVITLTYVDAQAQAADKDTGLPEADTYFQGEETTTATALQAKLDQNKILTYITYTQNGVTAVAITAEEQGQAPAEANRYSGGELVGSGTFVDMMADAQDGETVELVADVTISERVAIGDKAVTITDDGTKRTITITSTDRAFHLDATSALTITGTNAGGLNIVGCQSGKVGIMVNGELTMQGNITVRGYKCTNAADTTGGGFIYNAGSGTTTIDGVTFTGNNSAKAGGVIYSAGTLTLTDVTFTGNSTSTNGGAVYVAGGTATLNGVTASGNTANRGYDLYTASTAAVTVKDSSCTSGGNTTSNAALYINANNTLTLDGKVTAIINRVGTNSITLGDQFSTQSAINLWLGNYGANQVVLEGDADVISAAVAAGAVTSTRAVEKGFVLGTDGKLTAQ